MLGQQTRGQCAARTHRPGRASGGSAWPLAVTLALIGCGELHFVPSPYTPTMVALTYSSQEDVTILRWKVTGDLPLADTRFELLGPNGGYQPIDFTQSVFTGGLTACADGIGTCAQYVLRGQYPEDRARPIQAVHDVYGVLPGNVAPRKVVSETLTFDSFFPPANQMVYLNFPTDRISRDGAYVYPRRFERAMWPTNGLCVANTVPDGVSFLPLDESGGFPPEMPLTEEGMYCVAGRPIPSDGGPAVLLQKRIATQPELVTGQVRYTPPVERSPVIYQIILDLEIPVPDRCADVIQGIEQVVQSYMAGATYPVPVHKLPTVNLAEDGSSRCAQTNGRVVRSADMALAVKQLVATLPEHYHQLHLLYFNNLDGPLTQQLVSSFDSLVGALLTPIADKDLQLYHWMFNPGGGALPKLQVRDWWAFWVWQTNDESFEMKLDSYQEENLPRTTQAHDPNEPVELLSDDEVAAHEGDRIKVCSSSTSVTPVRQVPFQQPIFEPTWTITAADPPAYLVSLRNQTTVRGSEFLEESVLINYQICTRYCIDHGFVSETGQGVESWADSRACGKESL